MVSECVNKVARDFPEIEQGEVLEDDWKDEAEDLPQIQSDKVLHYFRPNWDGGRDNYKKVSAKSVGRGIL